MQKRNASWYKTVRPSGRWTWKSTASVIVLLALLLGGIGSLYAISQGWIEEPPPTEGNYPYSAYRGRTAN